jgi:hypothetical protein
MNTWFTQHVLRELRVMLSAQRDVLNHFRNTRVTGWALMQARMVETRLARLVKEVSAELDARRDEQDAIPTEKLRVVKDDGGDGGETRE